MKCKHCGNEVTSAACPVRVEHASKDPRQHNAVWGMFGIGCPAAVILLCHEAEPVWRAMSLAIEALRHLVRTDVLAFPERREWSIQGFGMLRTYLTPDVRLHVWDPEYRVEQVSDIHDHPWHFESLIVSGSIENRRFRVVEGEPTHSRGRIVCGPKPAEHGAQDVTHVRLEQWCEGVFHVGDSYSMRADELHASIPSRGAVSIIRRTKAEKDPDRALVYWPLGGEWVPAEPRPATAGIVRRITARALECWSEGQPK